MAAPESEIQVTATPFLKRENGGLWQLLRVKLGNESAQALAGVLTLGLSGQAPARQVVTLPPGGVELEQFIPEPRGVTDLEASLTVEGRLVATVRHSLPPPRHWRVHVVQLSHHDLGYTGLPSNVLAKQARYLDRALDLAAATTDFPDEARFRIVIEQAWSVDYFLQHAAPERAERMVGLLRSGQFELTALYGNLTTELCSPESLIQALYPSFRLKRRYGVPIVSAEHNDIPGFSWGLCRVLCDAGVKLLCAGLPLYYHWAETPYQSFWDQCAVFGFAEFGVPGAFWWEAADGRRLLFWCNHKGCGGSTDPTFPGLLPALEGAERTGYGSNVVRWPVQGGARDNSPYILDFAEAIRQWNEQWAYPQLICSTNARFFAEYAAALPEGLPVHRGELPGQDYPVGALSTARPTAVNRENHHALLSAAQLALVAASVTDYPHQTYELECAQEDTRTYEEHAWGHAYGHGPAMGGAEAEKGLHAYRAAAYAQDVAQKALAKLADHVHKDHDGLYLVVYNPLGFARSGIVRMPLRELENSETVMVGAPGPQQSSSLFDRAERTHLTLPEEFLHGGFELIDAASGDRVDFQLREVTAEDPSVPCAAQRSGLAQGRPGYFNRPRGWGRDCWFVVKDIPAMGYRTYRLEPAPERDSPPSVETGGGWTLENEFYAVTANPETGAVVSIFDKELNRELLDPQAPHRFGEVIVRSPYSDQVGPMTATARPRLSCGRVVSALSSCWSLPAHPTIRQTLLLYAGVKRIDFAVGVLKDATPLLDVHLAFPFALGGPAHFRYEGVGNVLEPVADFLPGAYADALAIQNWVEVVGEAGALVWASHDSPVVSLGRLWPGYVSPAHSCVLPARMPHPPQQAADFQHGWIYSTLFANNFCTNFSVTQSGEFSFRYSLTTAPGVLAASEAIQVGLDLATPLEAILTAGHYQGALPLSAGYLRVSPVEVVVQAARMADDGRGAVLRLWNPTARRLAARVEWPLFDIAQARLVTPTEEDTGRELLVDGQGFRLEIEAQQAVSVQVVPSGS